jgi:hypothetical protein
MSSLTQPGDPSPPAPPYPFRHVENRWHIVTIPAMVLLIYPVFAGQRLISWLAIAGFAAVGLVTMIVVGVAAYIALRKRYAPVLPRIVGGRKRLVGLASSMGFAAGVAATCLALFANFHWKRAPEHEVLGTVVAMEHRSGKAPGWDAVVNTPDDTLRMSGLAPEWVQVMRSHSRIQLRIQPGALGGAFVTSVSPAQ